HPDLPRGVATGAARLLENRADAIGARRDHRSVGRHDHSLGLGARVWGGHMSSYTATVRWSGDDPEAYLKGRYYRGHEWAFDGGTVVPASAAPENVPTGTANEAGVDPEEALIAA